MTRLHLTLGMFLSLSLTPIIKMEHHEIPILSNNTDINNSFTVSSFLNYTATLFNLQNGLDTDDSYDDSVGIMDDYIDGEETALSDDGHDVTDTSRTSLESLDEDDEDSDFNFLANRGRWSYLPKFVEKMCREECNMKGKPFGRLLGTTCQCYCPLNAPKLGLCEKSNSCDRYCSSIGFSRGGDCVYNKVCFCFCRKKEPYDASKVYTGWSEV